MPTFSFAVAVLDFVPVLASTTGYALLADWIARRRPAWTARAWTATALIAAGGWCKATWKLLESLDHHPPIGLGQSLLPLIAPGLILLNHGVGVALDATSAPDHGPSTARWLTGLFTLGALASGAAWATGAASKAGLLGLLVVAIAASTVLVLRCVSAARSASLPMATLGFAYNGLALYGLGALSRMAPGNRAAWWQEAVNLSAQAALAFAAWQLHRHDIRSSFPLIASQEQP